MYKFKRILFSGVLIYCLAACSSAPKRVMLVTDTRNAAASVYETANREMVAGKIENAGGHLQQAYNMGLKIDDADLLCRISLSAVVYKLSSVYQKDNIAPASQLARKPDDFAADTPFYGLNAEDMLNLAEEYSGRAEDKKLLRGITEIYRARIALSYNNLNIQETLLKLSETEKLLVKEPYYKGYLYRTQGDVYAWDKQYGKARDLYLKAAEIHTKNRYLEEIGLDYYSAARMSSLAGNKEDALTQIDKALKYDKDAENTSAIAADYYAYGLILLKNCRSDEEKQRAKKAILWAGQIYNAGGFIENAELCNKKAAEL